MIKNISTEIETLIYNEMTFNHVILRFDRKIIKRSNMESFSSKTKTLIYDYMICITFHQVKVSLVSVP